MNVAAGCSSHCTMRIINFILMAKRAVRIPVS
jgi:hypothetical protein